MGKQIKKNDKTNKKRNLTQQLNVSKARARRFAMQAVYQNLLTSDDYVIISEQSKAREASRDFDKYFFDEIITGVSGFSKNFEIQLSKFIDRPISQLDTVEHAILLVATYELNNSSTPPKVAINEAIILAKKFGGEDSHKFINSVLDKLYKSIKNNKR